MTTSNDGQIIEQTGSSAENIQDTPAAVETTETDTTTQPAPHATEQPPAWFEDRMKRFTKQKYDLEGKVTELSRQLEEARRPKDREATKEDFNGDLDRWTQHLAEKKFKELEAQKAIQYREAAKAEKAHTEIVDGWQGRLNSFKQTATDYEQVVTGADFDMSGEALLDLVQSDFGPQITYHLAKNPSEADKYSSLDQRGRDRYLARMEARYDATSSATSSTEPTTAPINPVSKAPSPASLPTGTRTGTQTKTLADFIKSRNEEDRKRGLI